MTTAPSIVGKAVTPVYATGKVTGALKFPPDVTLPNMLWMKILRSPHAHAFVRHVDTSAAEKMPGVVAVLTHKDVHSKKMGPASPNRALLCITISLHPRATKAAPLRARSGT